MNGLAGGLGEAVSGTVLLIFKAELFWNALKIFPGESAEVFRSSGLGFPNFKTLLTSNVYIIVLFG